MLTEITYRWLLKNAFGKFIYDNVNRAGANLTSRAFKHFQAISTGSQTLYTIFSESCFRREVVHLLSLQRQKKSRTTRPTSSTTMATPPQHTPLPPQDQYYVSSCQSSGSRSEDSDCDCDDIYIYTQKSPAVQEFMRVCEAESQRRNDPTNAYDYNDSCYESVDHTNHRAIEIYSPSEEQVPVSFSSETSEITWQSAYEFRKNIPMRDSVYQRKDKDLYSFPSH